MFVAKASDVPQNSMKMFDYNGEPAILVNFDGSFTAYVNNCPHRNLQFSATSLTGEGIKCPYHGATFDPKNGGYIGGLRGSNANPGSLTVINLKVDGDSIYAL